MYYTDRYGPLEAAAIIAGEAGEGGATQRDKSFREKSRAWFKRAPLDRDAALIAKAFLELSPKDAQALFVHTVKQKRLTLGESTALKERVWPGECEQPWPLHGGEL